MSTNEDIDIEAYGCEDCVFFKGTRDGLGVCYRYPPRMHLVPPEDGVYQRDRDGIYQHPEDLMLIVRPIVGQSSDACGEFRLKKT